MRSFKPIAYSVLNNIRGQFLYFARFIMEQKIDILIILDAFSSECYISPLLHFLQIPIINLRFDSVNEYDTLPKKLNKTFYKCRYPENWEMLKNWRKEGRVGIFHGVWTHEPRDRRVMKEEYLGLNARIYNILYRSQPDAYLLGFEPYTDPSPFNYSLFMRHIDHINEAKTKGYDHVELYKKGTYLFPSGDPWIIPYAPNKSFKVLICGQPKNGAIELRSHDIADFCEKHMFYNQFERGFNYHPNKNADLSRHYDFCNDCALDNYILTEYCKKYKKHFWNTWDFIFNQLKNDLFENGHGFLFPNKKNILSEMYEHESALVTNSRSTGL
jgi:hypothetical protein